MTICIISITDTDELARSLNRYFKCFLGPRIESYFMTYERNLLSGSLLRQADLIVLELLRRDDIGFRAEGLYAAEKWVQIGKRILIVSGTTQSDIIDNPAYWDLAAANQLHLKIQWLLPTVT